MSHSLFPAGHWHLHDPGGGDQENPQRRVRVLPLQPRTVVKQSEGDPRPPPRRCRAARLALFCHTSSRKALNRPDGFWPTPSCLFKGHAHTLSLTFSPWRRSKVSLPSLKTKFVFMSISLFLFTLFSCFKLANLEHPRPGLHFNQRVHYVTLCIICTTYWTHFKWGIPLCHVIRNILALSNKKCENRHLCPLKCLL